MRISDNALNVLAAKTYRGIGKAWIVKHIRGNETVNSLVALLNESSKEGRLITQELFENERNKINDSIARLEGFADGVVAIGDKDFPSYRGNVKSSEQPVALFYRGDIKLLHKANRNIAVIGLLTPDIDTEAVESEVVAKLVSCGATIVSGLALGCDTIAHRQALCSEGKTIAILPGSLDDISPAVNKGLAEEIVKQQGLLVTEYYAKAKSKMELIGRYQERDRLQALFSDCVVLTASYAKNVSDHDSGSRLAMEYAANYAIPRAVIYDPAKDGENKKYDLNRQLIREQGDIVVINRGNMDSAVSEIMRKKPHQPAERHSQAVLFVEQA